MDRKDYEAEDLYNFFRAAEHVVEKQYYVGPVLYVEMEITEDDIVDATVWLRNEKKFEILDAVDALEGEDPPTVLPPVWLAGTYTFVRNGFTGALVTLLDEEKND